MSYVEPICMYVYYIFTIFVTANSETCFNLTEGFLTEIKSPTTPSDLVFLKLSNNFLFAPIFMDPVSYNPQILFQGS